MIGQQSKDKKGKEKKSHPLVELKTRTSCHDTWTDTLHIACHRQQTPDIQRTPGLAAVRKQLRIEALTVKNNINKKSFCRS